MQAAAKRQNWIDVVKGIGIFFVVIAHVYSKNAINIWTCSLVMPLFFSLSGYIQGAFKYESKISFKDFLVKKAKTLLLPFVIFRVALVLYWLAVERHFRELDLGPIWFLPALFAAEIITYFINLKKKPALNGIFSVLCLVFLYIFKKAGFDNYDIGDWVMIILNGTTWYNMGVIYGRLCTKKPLNISKGAMIPILAVLFIISLVTSEYNGMVSMFSSVFGNYYIFIIESIAGSMFILLLCKYFLTSNKFLEFFGKNTLIILPTQEPIKRIIIKLIEIFCGKIGHPVTKELLMGNILYGFLLLVIVMLAEVVVIKILKLIKSKIKGKARILLSFVSD